MIKGLLTLFLVVFSSPLLGISINWATPTTLSTLGVNSTDPRLAIDPNGNIVAVWVENGFIKANTQPVSGSWGTATTISNTGATNPKIVVDSSGNATALWNESGVIKSATLPFGGSWSAATSLSSAGASVPQLAGDPNGDVVAIWVSGSGGIQSSTKAFGGSWPIPALVNTLSTSGDNPQIAIGANGTVVAIWHDVTSSIDTIYAATKILNLVWGLKQAISNGTQNSVYPKIAIDSNGNALALWYRYTLASSAYTNVFVQSASLPVSGSWSSPVDVSIVGGVRNPADFAIRVAFDGSGNAIATWTITQDDSNYLIHSAILPVNGSWTSSSGYTSDIYAMSHEQAVDSVGDAFLIYMAGSPLQIFSTNINIANYSVNAWINQQTVSNAGGNAFPRIAAVNNGSTIYTAAIWIRYNGANTVIRTATGTGTVFIPPSNVLVTQTTNAMGVLTEYYNTITWTASADPNLVGYIIYRNGFIIGMVNASTLQFVDHNRKISSSGSLTYGVAAVGIGHNQSAIVSVSFP